MNDYFQARGVNPQMYKNTKLPAYFKEVIESLPSQSKVLDFGCGFGQNLLALKEKNFDFIAKSFDFIIKHPRPYKGN
ncbi:hypothetical protein [Helicobacter typhlonius]|uniref:hypothetical protein n=1 Tax=Helicobacter typhlonius TaxID=76936 RepID=UPI002FE3A0EE